MVKPKVQNPVIEWRSGWRKKTWVTWWNGAKPNKKPWLKWWVPTRKHLFKKQKWSWLNLVERALTQIGGHIKTGGKSNKEPTICPKPPPKKKIQGVATLWVERIHIHIQRGTSWKSSSTQTCRLLNMIQKGPGGWQHNPKSPVKLMFTHNLKREKNIPALKLTAKLPENGCLEDDELSFWSEGSQTWSMDAFLYESTISLSPQAALLKFLVWQSRPMQRSAAFQNLLGFSKRLSFFTPKKSIK